MVKQNINIYLAGKVNGAKVKLARMVSQNLPSKEITWHRSDGGNHSEHAWGYGSYEYGNEYLKGAVQELCLDEIDGSEILIAYLDCYTSFGSIAEIAYASSRNKPSYLLINDPFEEICNCYLDATTHTYDDIKCEHEEYHQNSLRLFDAYWFISHFPRVSTYIVYSIENAAQIATQICKLESPIEHLLFQSLNARSPYMEVQYGIGAYRVDFAFPENKVAVEVDGHAYHSSKEQRGRDAQRDRFLQSEGWRVLRFTGSEVFADPQKCAREIKQIASQLFSNQVSV